MAGNHFLYGDVDFDGIVNLEDVKMVKAQLGSDTSRRWGTGAGEYNPDCDFNGNGVIDEYDVRVVEAMFGNVSPWKVVNKNPSLIDGGAGWYPQNAANLGDTWGATTQYTSFRGDRGFSHYISITPTEIGGATWTEAGIGEPYEHPDPINPQPWEGDVPLEHASNHDFYFTAEISNWVPSGGYLSTGFGGWIILQKPYTITCLGPSPRIPIIVKCHPRIIEVHFAVRHEGVSPGGDDWHRIICRPGFHMDFSKGWFIFIHVFNQIPVGKYITRLPADVFSSLIERLESDQPFMERNVPNPMLHGFTEIGFCRLPEMRDVDLTGAKFRLAFLFLEGGRDPLGDPYPTYASVSHYGIYHYYKQSGVLWKPVMSSVTNVGVTA